MDAKESRDSLKVVRLLKDAAEKGMDAEDAAEAAIEIILARKVPLYAHDKQLIRDVFNVQKRHIKSLREIIEAMSERKNA